MRNFNNYVFMSKKRGTNKAGSRFLACFVCGPQPPEKLSTAVNATRHATRILLRGVNEK